MTRSAETGLAEAEVIRLVPTELAQTATTGELVQVLSSHRPGEFFTIEDCRQLVRWLTAAPNAAASARPTGVGASKGNPFDGPATISAPASSIAER